MKLAIIGFGSRGRFAYLPTAIKQDGVELVAVCDIKQVRLDEAREKYGLTDDQLFLSDEEFFAKGKLADLLFVTTQDKDHYQHAMKALDVGYDLLLEKPIAQSYEQCKEISDKAEKLGRKICICHVLRYAPFFTYIKDVIDSGKIGSVRTISQTENVAYWHYAHSYARGNWKNTKESTPMLLAKCCHDLDIIYWLVGSPCKAVSSFGSLEYFTPENAPEGSSDRCIGCKYEDTCVYSAKKFYTGNVGWLANNFDEKFDSNNPDEVRKMLAKKEVPYGDCVYKCGNDTVDHQVVNMLFENNATAQLTMTAFSKDCYRELHVHGNKGEIIGNMETNLVTINVYGGESETIDIGQFSDGLYGHGGGDARLTLDILNYMEFGDTNAKGLTTIQNSLMSHKMGYCAEESRLAGGKLVELK